MEWKDLCEEAKSVIEWVESPITNFKQIIKIEIGKYFIRNVPVYHRNDSGEVKILITCKLFNEICEYIVHNDDMDYAMSETSLVFKLKNTVN